MKPLQSVAFIGNHLPRRCGIATFTHHLHLAVATARPDLQTGVVAMNDRRMQPTTIQKPVQSRCAMS